MKTLTKIRFAVVVLITSVSLASCSVEYRARHPRPTQKKVIVVGMVAPVVPIGSNVASIAPVANASVVNTTK